jgi:hypothetical protein
MTAGSAACWLFSLWWLGGALGPESFFGPREGFFEQARAAIVQNLFKALTKFGEKIIDLPQNLAPGPKQMFFSQLILAGNGPARGPKKPKNYQARESSPQLGGWLWYFSTNS